MSALRENLLDLSDVAGSRLLARVQGLTDDEYFWEPVPDVWTVRRADSGPRIDGSAFPPEPPPFTTLAWRVTHLIDILLAERRDLVRPDPGTVRRDARGAGLCRRGGR